jgi:hypothetical protein
LEKNCSCTPRELQRDCFENNLTVTSTTQNCTNFTTSQLCPYGCLNGKCNTNPNEVNRCSLFSEEEKVIINYKINNSFYLGRVIFKENDKIYSNISINSYTSSYSRPQIFFYSFIFNDQTDKLEENLGIFSLYQIYTADASSQSKYISKISLQDFFSGEITNISLNIPSSLISPSITYFSGCNITSYLGTNNYPPITPYITFNCTPYSEIDTFDCNFGKFPSLSGFLEYSPGPSLFEFAKGGKNYIKLANFMVSGSNSLEDIPILYGDGKVFKGFGKSDSQKYLSSIFYIQKGTGFLALAKEDNKLNYLIKIINTNYNSFLNINYGDVYYKKNGDWIFLEKAGKFSINGIDYQLMGEGYSESGLLLNLQPAENNRTIYDLNGNYIILSDYFSPSYSYNKEEFIFDVFNPDGVRIEQWLAYWKDGDAQVRKIDTYCGDNICDQGENHVNCPGDCLQLDSVKTESLECMGCNYESSCLPFGFRKNGQYCDISKNMTIQKDVGAYCENGFECRNDICSDFRCAESVEKSIGGLKKFFCWIAALFPGVTYERCLSSE